MEISPVKCIAKNNPVIIWIIKLSPKRDPKFHQKEIEEGEGRSISALLIIFNNG
jgi:hypothetical protein